MANTIRLRDQEFTLGDLTAATLEDHPDAVRDFFVGPGPAESAGLGRAQLSAILTLGTEAVRRGGHDLTREQFRDLVQLPDLAVLYVAVGKALGLNPDRTKALPGEAQGPESSRPSASSSGA